MPTILEVIDAFDRQEFSKVQEYIKNIQDAKYINADQYVQTQRETRQVDIDRAFPFLQDLSNGPLTNGIEILDATSRVISGVSYSGINKFIQYNFLYSPQQFRSTDDESGIILVLNTIQMKQYYDLLRTVNATEYADFKAFMLKLFKRVKSGVFNKDELGFIIKTKCKRVVKICLNYRQVV